MWVRAGHPGWGRLALAVAFGPLAAPVPLIFLEDNPAAALLTLLTTSNDVTQTASGFAYPITIVLGLPAVLGLATVQLAGFLPVVGVGAALGAVCWALFGALGGSFMFLGSLGASSACWLIAFVNNPRAHVARGADQSGRVLRLTS